MLVALALGIAVVVAVIVVRSGGGDGDGTTSADRPRPSADREGSTRLPASAPDVVVGSTPSAYRVTYRVEDYAGGDRIDSYDTYTVRRPYQGRSEVRRNEEDASPLSKSVTDFGRVSLDGAEGAPLLVETPPALAGSDLRLDVVLTDAEAAGLVERRERRRVAGAPCVVVRTRVPIVSGTLSAERPTASDYTDTCVAASGLVVEELWVSEGRVLRRRLATSIDLDPPAEDLGASTFAAFGTRLDPRQGGGSTRPVDPASRPAGAPFWDGLLVPEGFAYRGRYAVVPPQRSPDSDEATLGSSPLDETARSRVGAVVDVWERGIDVLVLEQGGSVDKSAVLELVDGAPTIEVPGLGTGSVVLDGRSNELRFPLPAGRYVRVAGTLPRAQLEATAAALHDIGEGTGLQYLDG